MDEPGHVEATIHLLSTDEGGRLTPLRFGYRPGFHVPGDEWGLASMFMLGLMPDPLYPGDSGRIRFSFLHESWQHLAPLLYIGKEFEIREGSHLVGNGIVEWLADPPAS